MRALGESFLTNNGGDWEISVVGGGAELVSTEGITVVCFDGVLLGRLAMGELGRDGALCVVVGGGGGGVVSLVMAAY